MYVKPGRDGYTSQSYSSDTVHSVQPVYMNSVMSAFTGTFPQKPYQVIPNIDDLEEIRLELTTVIQTLNRAKMGRNTSKIAETERELEGLVRKEMQVWKHAFDKFRAKLNDLSSISHTNIEKRDSINPPKRRHRKKKPRPAIRPTSAPNSVLCPCLLAVSKRMKAKEFRKAVESGDVICTCQD